MTTLLFIWSLIYFLLVFLGSFILSFIAIAYVCYTSGYWFQRGKMDSNAHTLSILNRKDKNCCEKSE